MCRKNVFRWDRKISKTSNRSSGNDALTAEFCKNFSNELVPVLLDNYDSWGNFGTVGVTFRTGIMPVISVISGDKFIHMIKNTFTIIQSKTEINAPLSNICTLIWAVRLGCPPSMLLYIIEA